MDGSMENDVNLPEVSSIQFQRPGALDPQRVMVRQNNTATLYLDTISQDPRFINTKTDIVVSSGRRASILSENIRRLAPRSFGITWYIPNINPRNNKLTIFSSVSGTEHTVTLDEGFYFKPEDLINHIVARLNTVLVASGLTFSAVPNMFGATFIINRYTISATGGEFYFIDTCDAVKKGATLWAPPIEQVLSTSKSTGFMNMRYTTYINIISSTLTQYTKNQPNSNEPNSNGGLIARIIIDDPNSFDRIENPLAVPYGLITETIPSDLNTNWINFDASQSITTVDVRLLDQYGDLLYVPDETGFDWYLFISTQSA